MTWVLLALAGVWAGAQNAVAGGGSFITLPALIFAGLDARAANITSTVALSVGQVTTGWAGRKAAGSVPGIPFWLVALLAILGGIAGAQLILLTPARVFADMVPWLILIATALFAWGSFGPKREAVGATIGRFGAAAGIFLASVYGGYFGGGMGIIFITLLSAAGMAIRAAGATKNVLAAFINAAAVLVFLFAPEVDWAKAAALGGGAIVGGYIGNHLLHTINERALRIIIVAIGVALSIGLFLR
jgi:uncharacterized protein